MLSKLTMLSLVIFATSACTVFSDRVPKAAPVSVACSGFDIINPSRQDTDGTKQQILVHNRTYRSLCPGVPK